MTTGHFGDVVRRNNVAFAVLPQTGFHLVFHQCFHLHHTVLIWGTASWVVGLLGSLLFYGLGARKDRLKQTVKPLYALLKSRLLIDELYDYYVAKIQQRFAIVLSFLDVFLLRGIIIRGGAGIVSLTGSCLRLLHVGSIHAYVYWFLVGLIVLWALAAGIRF